MVGNKTATSPTPPPTPPTSSPFFPIDDNDVDDDGDEIMIVSEKFATPARHNAASKVPKTPRKRQRYPTIDHLGAGPSASQSRPIKKEKKQDDGRNTKKEQQDDEANDVKPKRAQRERSMIVSAMLLSARN